MGGRGFCVCVYAVAGRRRGREEFGRQQAKHAKQAKQRKKTLTRYVVSVTSPYKTAASPLVRLISSPRLMPASVACVCDSMCVKS